MYAWSGLAPAVNNYLARWGEVRKSRPLLEMLLSDRPLNRSPQTIPEELQRWIVFGQSYGLPQADGSIITGLMIEKGQLDRLEAGGSLEGNVTEALRHVRLQDGATIQGREQLGQPGRNDVLTGAWLANRELNMLDNAIPHYVSAEVVEEVGYAITLMEPEPLFETDLVTPCGFAVFEQPVIVTDLHPSTGVHDPNILVGIRAMAWQRVAAMAASDGTIVSGISLFLYTTPQDQIDIFLPTVVKAAPELHLDYVEMAMALETMNPHAFVPTDVIPWGFGREWTIREDVAHMPGTVPTPVAETRRWFLGFMRFMWQEIIIREKGQPRNRAEGRRWERTKPDMDLTVLRLRRFSRIGSTETGTGAQLGYRLKVRGHWRRQFFPTLGEARLADGSMNPASHRLVWIETHYRGPDDAPLRISIDATAVTR